MPVFSIIIPTYNSSATLRIALESVLSQTLTDFEVLLIDGLSTDNTVEIAEGYNDKRIKTFSGKDLGVYDAMNKGIAYAKAEWIYFLGSDDELFNQNVLSEVAQFAGKTNSDIVYGNSVIIGDVRWAKNGTIHDGVFNIKKLLIRNICHQSIFYKRDLIKQHNIQFDLKYPVCSDWDFNLKCWSVKEFTYIDKIIAKFNAGGISSMSVKDNFADDIVSKFIQYFKIRSYFKLRKLIPAQRQSQFMKMKPYKWFRRIDLYLKRLVK